ncbi:hypothetical protein BLA29_010094 [Euroglyphus maynei]|uniref:Uncharacterized protein n=1 Tax=Euroglyphus maynei TaxID=6958 RepID=A0A1Y3BJY6_EURMA|nr:hypothetical protein BLA29_010094 [Euroglyphus maynei]
MMLGAQPISVSKARHNNNQAGLGGGPGGNGGGSMGGSLGNRNRFPPSQRDQSFNNNRNDSQFRPPHY